MLDTAQAKGCHLYIAQVLQFTKEIQALRQLVKDICSRYAIRYVVRHSDIAPGRKDDPWCFNWQRFQYDVHQSMAYLQFPTSEPTLLAHHKH